jgi:hypothetical protein
MDLDKFKVRMEKYPNGTTMPNLATQIMSLLPTPKAMDGNNIGRDLDENGMNINKKGIRFGVSLPQLAKSNLLPTPAAVDYKQTTLCESQRERSTLPGVMVKMFLPTPVASDCRVHYPTENWKGTSDLGSVINGINGTRSHLSPQFVMEMMGFPTDWTLLPFLNGETNQSKQEATQ